jgi:ribosomal protein S18 acetylase RimI-like enzyme
MIKSLNLFNRKSNRVINTEYYLILGEILGVCTGVNLTPNFAFIGQYAVRPQYQGLGIGSALWKKVMEHIGTERNISLFAVEEMFETYQKKGGFVIVPQKKNSCV